MISDLWENKARKKQRFIGSGMGASRTEPRLNTASGIVKCCTLNNLLVFNTHFNFYLFFIKRRKVEGTLFAFYSQCKHVSILYTILAFFFMYNNKTAEQNKQKQTIRVVT